MSQQNKLHTGAIWEIGLINQTGTVYGSPYSSRKLRSYNYGFLPSFKRYIELTQNARYDV